MIYLEESGDSFNDTLSFAASELQMCARACAHVSAWTYWWLYKWHIGPEAQSIPGLCWTQTGRRCPHTHWPLGCTVSLMLFLPYLLKYVDVRGDLGTWFNIPYLDPCAWLCFASLTTERAWLLLSIFECVLLFFQVQCSNPHAETTQSCPGYQNKHVLFCAVQTLLLASTCHLDSTIAAEYDGLWKGQSICIISDNTALVWQFSRHFLTW